MENGETARALVLGGVGNEHDPINESSTKILNKTSSTSTNTEKNVIDVVHITTEKRPFNSVKNKKAIFTSSVDLLRKQIGRSSMITTTSKSNDSSSESPKTQQTQMNLDGKRTKKKKYRCDPPARERPSVSESFYL